MAVKKILTSPFVGITALVALIALITRFSSIKFKPQQRLFSVEELALYNGTDDSRPILLGILGSVFDVTKGKSHYGVGGGYHHFAGRFVRCFPCICFRKLYRCKWSIVIFILYRVVCDDENKNRMKRLGFVYSNTCRLEKLRDGLTDSLNGLSSTEVKSIVDWRDFYFRSYTSDVNVHSSLTPVVRFAGKLVGRYYDSQGNPTKYLKGAEAKAKRGAQLLEKQKAEEAKQPGCNSRWSQDEGGEVWCESGVPRLVQRPIEIALTGKMSKRCVCFEVDQLDQPGLEVYEGCDYLAKTCRV
ncbi:hypothetical protein Pint_16896 [Pistacia integerrima]|uniref:Uncharacterized protein n=1 Tax=Pistacia integerrima TaxID=434235 RepID=A0ACC0ZG92_9ROSI|nr:hypothetical protein Pint_16896 [Pistacia integerrima]